ncbi:hypothetical protein ACFL0V_06010 [Nanoarchaeota archaeon]
MTYQKGAVVNKFYVNIGQVNVNHGNVNYGIQHTIAAERTGDVHVYNNIESVVNQQITNNTNYVVNMDNRKVEFIEPYSGRKVIGENGSGALDGYAQQQIGTDYNSAPAYQQSITQGLLKKRRPVVQFVEDMGQVRELVEETFEKVTGERFPENIVVSVCDEQEMKKAHTHFGGDWNPGIMGFAINKTSEASSIFVRENDLDELMLTLGHEIGHVLTRRLGNAVDEEAKAFAFEMAWVKAIIEHDVGGLGESFNPDFTPAENGLHDKAFMFVKQIVDGGKDAMRVFKELAIGALRS